MTEITPAESLVRTQGFIASTELQLEKALRKQRTSREEWLEHFASQGKTLADLDEVETELLEWEDEECTRLVATYRNRIQQLKGL